MGSPSISGGNSPRPDQNYAASLDAARRIAPRSNAAGRQLGQAFLAQLQAMGTSLADDAMAPGTDESNSSDESSGMPDSSLASMLPALTAMQQARKGSGGREAAAIIAMLQGGTSGGTQSGAGAELLSSLTAGLPVVDGGGAASSAAAASPIPSAPIPAHEQASVRSNAAVVADVARQVGVDPRTAIAMMLVESGGNNRSVGDGGTSFGLFQLHRGGMLTAAGLTPEQAMDPRTNAMVSLRSLASYAASRPHAAPGTVAAASQRPADPVGYAARVDAMLARADRLLASL